MGMIAKLIIAAVCSYLFNLFCKGSAMYRSLAQARDPLVNGKLRLRNKEQLSWRKGWLLGPWAVAPSFELVSCLDLHSRRILMVHHQICLYSAQH